MRNRLRVVLTSALAALLATGLLVVDAASAQDVPLPKFNSPFSRVGVGDLVPFAYSAQLGMGGIGRGYTHTHIASPTNPASLAALRFTSFQVGVGLDRSVLTDGRRENENINGNLQYLSLSFPLQNQLNQVLDGQERKWRNAMMLALAPYSNVGYNVELVERDPDFGQVVNGFRGSGGYYRLQWGNGVEYEDFRAGLNLSYIFGRTNNQQEVFPRSADSTAFGASLLTDTDALRARGVEAQLGFQYDWLLGGGEDASDPDARVLTLGLTTRFATQLNGEATRLLSNQNIFRVVDTLSFERDASQRVTLPGQVGIGAFYRAGRRFGAGFDVSRTAWSNFENSLRSGEDLDDALRVAVGAEWTPDAKAYGKFWKRARYRVGGYANQDPRPGVNPEYGLTFGLGLPVVRPREEVSYVNLALNAGRYGTDGDISQRYVRLVVGFTLTDNTWFYKRRFQ